MVTRRRAFGPVIMALLLVFVWGCARQDHGGKSSTATKTSRSSQTRATSSKGKLRMLTSGVKELSWQSGGKYIMRAKAKALAADEETGRARLTQAQAILFKGGKEAASLSADLIEADMKAGTLTATGGIAARSLVRNSEVSAQRLTWLNRQNRLVGSGGVSMKSDVGGISGDRLDADTTLKQVTLYSEKGGRASLNAAALEGSQ